VGRGEEQKIWAEHRNWKKKKKGGVSKKRLQLHEECGGKGQGTKACERKPPPKKGLTELTRGKVKCQTTREMNVHTFSNSCAPKGGESAKDQEPRGTSLPRKGKKNRKTRLKINDKRT